MYEKTRLKLAHFFQQGQQKHEHSNNEIDIGQFFDIQTSNDHRFGQAWLLLKKNMIQVGVF